MAMFPKKPSEGCGCAIDRTREQQVSEDTRGVPALRLRHLAVPGDVVVGLALQLFACILRQHEAGNGEPTGLYRTYEDAQRGYP